GNHGFLNGPVAAIDRAGQASSAYSFNGSQYIQIPNSDSLSFGLSDLSVSAWIKTTATGVGFIYSDDADNYRPGFELSHAGLEGIYEFSPTRSGGVTGNFVGRGKISVNDGQWHLLTLTFDRDGRTRLYVDGTLDVDQGSPSNLESISNAGDSRIGMNLGGAGGFVGIIDEVRLYNRALSAEEVSRLAGVTPMEFADVANPGNAADSVTGYGRVNYAYQISKHEVTVAQYAQFLNAVAQSDPNGLYNTNMATDTNVAGITRSGSSGSYTYAVISGRANRPITYVNWYDAARYVNWLHNGATNGANTETGAYDINQPLNLNAIRLAGAKYALPTVNEWYKAAYYDPTKGGTGGY
ncbi:MAG: hypothetical protein EBZ78_13640, partial [Verrucomicrobia bacterium]|nr:hypothetical protein [Verrucomicrobiota bacterium]